MYLFLILILVCRTGIFDERCLALQIPNEIRKVPIFSLCIRASLHSLHRLKSKLMMSQRRSLRQPKGIRCVGSWAPAPRRGTKGHKEQWSSGHIYTHQMGKCIENQPALRALSREKGQFENLWRFT